MELTTALPVSQWYFHDLQWWGLDYPPLTAYHSWLIGKIGHIVNPSWFTLYKSRGLDDPLLKVFMRASVLISEYLVYVPAVVIFVRRYGHLPAVSISSWQAQVALTAILLQPATILIDHVHFQYNTVMLGLVIASMSSLLAGRYGWASVFFVAALGFKQMALYFAPAIFAYLLGSCVFPKLNLGRFVSIALVTVASFALLIAPIVIGAVRDYKAGVTAQPELAGSRPVLPFAILDTLATKWSISHDTAAFAVLHQLSQLVHRVFPFARGLFEDKVANIWCATNVVYKLKHLPTVYLQRLSLLATLGAITPPCVLLFLYPRKAALPWGMASCAWAFFLLSFQVHEKSVLLPLAPMTLLLAGREGMGPEVKSWVGFANLLAAWTMYPLLSRVELRIPYVVLTGLWAYLLGLPPVSLSTTMALLKRGKVGQLTAATHGGFYWSMLVWHVAEAFVAPPERLPDLWVVLNVLVGAAGFVLCYLWCVVGLARECGLVGEEAKIRSAVGKEKAVVERNEAKKRR
jgi:alpha-1,3-glucosyltransferase